MNANSKGAWTTRRNLPRLEPEQAEAVLRAFEHRHAVVHLAYASVDEPDATRRIGALLDVDDETVKMILDQPLWRLLPEHRAMLAPSTD